ncbi:MAG: cytochrome b N-terminal domain-containing protein [Thermoprotei archaeon]
MNKRDWFSKLVDWVDDRFGFTNTILRPVPRYSLNPVYWLGALAFLAFLLQGLTGMMMLQYYVPTPEGAYDSTMKIIDTVPYGRLVESFHLYMAYAMVFLAFLHFVRGYFVGVYKRPRELMWIVGMLMGFVTLGLAFTGYLLPWTVISKSATDVSIGLVGNIPEPLSGWIKYLLSGAGSDEELLARFFALHVVILPAVLIILLALKMHMFEVHGVSEPLSNRFMKDMIDYREDALKPVKWFPEVFMYFTTLSLIFLGVMFSISALFPIEMPPQYSPEIAAMYTPQPEWYFLWMYQILKIEIFEGEGVKVALGLLGLLVLVIIILPFIDRSSVKHPIERPITTTLGIIGVVELIILTVWGAITPGQTIKNEEAFLFLVLPAIIISVISYFVYKRISALKQGKVVMLYEKFLKHSYGYLNFLISSLMISVLTGIISCSIALFMQRVVMNQLSLLSSTLLFLLLILSSITMLHVIRNELINSGFRILEVKR